MNEPAAMLARLDAIGRALSSHDDALALIGLGATGQALDRLDAYSDLDAFVIVRPEAKPRFLSDPAWLAAFAPVVFRYRGPRNGLHVLFADGIYCELAVLTVAELATTGYAPGRIVWKRPWVSEGLIWPSLTPPAPRWRDMAMTVDEILCNLLVGLKRLRRGEGQAAVREIQRLAVDRFMELAAQIELEAPGAADPFAPARRFEQRFPEMAAQMPSFQQGYDRTPESAAAMLNYLSARFPLNEPMVAAIRALL